ncbi:MAG: hypothetical protein R3D67_18275 [Hyphomicrobiaceae bacterium]
MKQADDISQTAATHVEANGAMAASVTHAKPQATSPWRYLATTLLVAGIGLGTIASANMTYAPEMYNSRYMASVASALAEGENYAVFDLNINIRELRNEHIKRLPKKPQLVILGASQWQEAGEDLIATRGYYNAHVHRDYYEDMLGMVEMLSRHDRLPKHMVITIRDRLFTPVAERTDYLWLPILPYYRAMAKRLSLEPHPVWTTYPTQRPRELLSLPMLLNNMTRWHNATDWPYPTAANRHETLDLLRPDGSIRWSDAHQALFTRERARKMALEHAAYSIKHPLEVDPKGVEAIDRLLAYLAIRGVKVHLAHPPFNPIFFEAIKGTPYQEGLERIREITQELAQRHKLDVIGSFNPAAISCTSDMFIDAEHSQSACLRNLLADVTNSIDLPIGAPKANEDLEVASRKRRSHRVMMATGWLTNESEATPSSKGPSRLGMMSEALSGQLNASATDRHLAQQKRRSPFSKSEARILNQPAPRR